jgi:hypothetical protein
MADFKPGVEVVSDNPVVEVTITAANPLRVGRHVFHLDVVDDSGNKSTKPDEVVVVVADTQAPTAVLQALPSQVPFGQSFKLSGEKSFDVGGGTVVKWIFTLVQ